MEMLSYRLVNRGCQEHPPPAPPALHPPRPPPQSWAPQHQNFYSSPGQVIQTRFGLVSFHASQSKAPPPGGHWLPPGNPEGSSLPPQACSLALALWPRLWVQSISGLGSIPAWVSAGGYFELSSLTKPYSAKSEEAGICLFIFQFVHRPYLCHSHRGCRHWTESKDLGGGWGEVAKRTKCAL